MNHQYRRALEVLGIRHGSGEEDVTEKVIRRAYATRIKGDARPDTNPEIFNAVRDAYNTALAEIKQLQAKKHAAQSININNIDDQPFKDASDSQPPIPGIQPEEPSNTLSRKISPSFNDLQSSHDIHDESKDAWQESTEDEQGVQRYFLQMAQLLDRKKNKDLGIEIELLKLCDLILKHGSNVSVIKELRYREQLAVQVSAHDAAPLSLVKKLVTELEFEGMAELSSTPEPYTRLQSKYTDMLQVKAFEVRADGNSEFERHFIHGGKPPTRIGDFPTVQDKERYSHTASWLLTCKPPRPDLIHPDSELIAQGKYVAPGNTKPEPVAVSRNFRATSQGVLIVGVLAFFLLFIVARF